MGIGTCVISWWGLPRVIDMCVHGWVHGLVDGWRDMYGCIVDAGIGGLT